MFIEVTIAGPEDCKVLINVAHIVSVHPRSYDNKDVCEIVLITSHIHGDTIVRDSYEDIRKRLTAPSAPIIVNVASIKASSEKPAPAPAYFDQIIDGIR
jgi:proteasome lid subunit RPN8/RPN11